MSIDVQRSMDGLTLTEKVAEEIRVVLARRRMSQAELARRLEVSAAWLNYRLTGKQPIDLNDLARIAEALGVQPATLLSSPRATGESSTPRRNRRHEPTLTREKTSTGPPSYPNASRRPALVSGRPFG